MYLYENRYSNYLTQNLIRVRYANNKTIVDSDYSIRTTLCDFSNVNDIITFKLFLYLGCLITKRDIENNTILLETEILKTDLKISQNKYLKRSLDYLKSITFKYNFYKGKNPLTKRFKTETRECNIIDDYSFSRGSLSLWVDDNFISLICYYKNQLIDIPEDFFKLDIKSYRHSAFLMYSLLLNRKRNYGKDRANYISVKELIKHCPLLPLYEELGEDKQITRSIISPFEKNMNYLATTFGFEWQYENEINNTYIGFYQNKVLLNFNEEET